MLSWRSRCSSMSSRTVPENAVSSSCILAPEGPVAYRVGRDTEEIHQWSGGSRSSPRPLPQGPSVTGQGGVETLSQEGGRRLGASVQGQGPSQRAGIRKTQCGAWAPGPQLLPVSPSHPPRPQTPATTRMAA